jgi:hypothetical protein
MSNIQKLADRLREIEAGEKVSEFAKLLWKPKEGVQKVRIVPYMFNPESPFIELKFYYKLAGGTYLAPCTFGKPDPIQKLVETLRASGSNEEKEIAAKLNPTPRTYAPVIVRGEEDLGVRFWGFGITVYKQLLKLMTNSDWGDITSWTEGNDLEVEFHKESKKKGKDGKSFPETNITPLPRKTPVVDPTRRDLMEKVKAQTDILKVFPLKSYDELKDAVNKWLHPEDSESATNEENLAKQAEAAGVDSQPAAAPAATAPAAVTPAPSAATPSGAAVSDEFARFFAQK